MRCAIMSIYTSSQHIKAIFLSVVKIYSEGQLRGVQGGIMYADPDNLGRLAIE